MTTPESITVGLEQAKQLKEAGWPQDDRMFYWCDVNKPSPGESAPWDLAMLPNLDEEQLKFVCAAPTAEEVLRRLPVFIKENGKEFYLKVNPQCRFPDASPGQGWQVWYVSHDDKALWLEVGDYTSADIANAAAAMYCYLAENNLLSAPQQ